MVWGCFWWFGGVFGGLGLSLVEFCKNEEEGLVMVEWVGNLVKFGGCWVRFGGCWVRFGGCWVRFGGCWVRFGGC